MPSSAVAFDVDRHVYSLDGRPLISVTQAIREAGLVDDAWWTDAGRERGTFVHAAVALDVEGDLDETALDPALVPYLVAWRRFLAESGFRIEAVEQRVVDEVLGYAGTLDVLGRFGQRRALLDIKTGTPLPWVALQLAAYKRCLPDAAGIRRYSLELRSDCAYRLDEWSDRNDDRVFLAALAVAQWRRAHGIR